MTQPKVQFTRGDEKGLYHAHSYNAADAFQNDCADASHRHGYKTELLENCGQNVKDCGLKYVHNDTCYPALLVIGQFMDAITVWEVRQSQGGADAYPNRRRTAVLPTISPCCARRLEKAGYGYVPVISLNISGLERTWI